MTVTAPHPDTGRFYPEFGYYALPGHALDPRTLPEELTTGERLGLGSVWLSERLNTKSVEVCSGVAAALTTRMGIASGLMSNMPLRNPLVSAAYASTMSKLTGDRFALGIGRGVNALADRTGTPRLTFRLMNDYIDVMRRLWRGETVSHDGPAGRFEGLALGAELETPPPIIAAAMGDQTARWAGRVCDGVVFNSLWSAKAVANSAEMVRQGAEEAGRNPAEVRIWTVLVTACDVPRDVMLATIIRRMNTYLYIPGMFEDLCQVNGWDPAPLPKLRAALAEIDTTSATGVVGDEATTRDHTQLERLAAMYPEEWIAEGNAVGDPEQALRAVRDRLDAGADGILFHGTHPADLATLLTAWDRHRTQQQMPSLANPGRAGAACPGRPGQAARQGRP
jgi:5,10-methylenetetrahydromethanopterin reductase